MKYYLTIAGKAGEFNELNWAKGLLYNDGKIYQADKVSNPHDYEVCNPHNLEHIAYFCMSSSSEKKIIEYIGKVALADYEAGIIKELPTYNPDNQLSIKKPKITRQTRMKLKPSEPEIIGSLKVIFMGLIGKDKYLKSLRSAEYSVDEEGIVTVKVANKTVMNKLLKEKNNILNQMINIFKHSDFELNVEIKEKKYKSLPYGIPLKKDRKYFDYPRLNAYLKVLINDPEFIFRLIGKFKRIPYQENNINFLRSTLRIINRDKFRAENKDTMTFNDFIDIEVVDENELDRVVDDFMQKEVFPWDAKEGIEKYNFLGHYNLAMWVKNQMELYEKNKILSELNEPNMASVQKKKLIPQQTILF